MSRSFSPDALRAMFLTDTDSTLAILITFYSPDNPEQAVLRITDGYTGTLANLETTTQSYYGITSRNEDYLFVPVNIVLPNDEDSSPRATINLAYVTPEMLQYIRTNIVDPPRVKLELVLTSTPDTVEATFDSFYIVNISYTATSVQLELSMINYDKEPFPQYSFTPQYFPGLY